MMTQLDKESKVEAANNGATDSTTKLRILCLHGFRTSGSILSQQIALANWGPIVDDIAELVFVDAPWPAKGKSDVEHKFAGPYFEWYQSNADFSEFYGREEASSHFVDCMALHGPFDGLLGFSQGAILTGAWMGSYEKGIMGAPNLQCIKFMVLVGGAPSRVKHVQAAYTDAINCPSLHFIGDKDFLKEPGEVLVKACKDPVVIRHGYGHVVPRLAAGEAQIFRDFLLKKLESKISS